MKTTEFVFLHDAGWMKFQSALKKLSAEKMIHLLADREWTIKDVIAHITWHENEMIGMVNAREVDGSPLWQLSTDDRNHQIYLHYKDRQLADVLLEADRVHAEMMKVLAVVAEDELNDPSRWKNWPEAWSGEWTPWKVIASNTYEHYADHLPDLLSS